MSPFRIQFDSGSSSLLAHRIGLLQPDSLMLLSCLKTPTRNCFPRTLSAVTLASVPGSMNGEPMDVFDPSAVKVSRTLTQFHYLAAAFPALRIRTARRPPPVGIDDTETGHISRPGIRSPSVR